jgi:hypothetical protein
MLIRIKYNNGPYDFVKPSVLNRLFEEKKLDRFKRK